MINEQITAYIQHYMEKDKTRSAIMLTGAWGTGKSYYIQHELVPALQEKNKKGCITVSLYGLKSLSEISKNIYFELKAKLLNKDTEGAVVGKLFAKTLAKGITSTALQ